jgi:hypothetical protein
VIDYSQDQASLRWASERIGDSFDPRLSSWLTLKDEHGTIAAVTVFTGWSDHNVFISFAAQKPVTLAYTRAVFQYAFQTLGVTRITFMSRVSNKPAIELHKRLGATHEAMLSGFYGAEDAACSRILKSECRWLGASSEQSVQVPQST